MNDLVIVGTGGMGREVHAWAEDAISDGARWRFLGFLDGNPDRIGTSVHDSPVLGTPDWVANHPGCHVLVAIGNCAARRRVALHIASLGATLPTLIHPSAYVGRRVELGDAGMICAHAVLTTDLRVGRGAIVNFCANVGHDALLGDWVTIAPNANISGAARLGDGVDVGSGACVLPGRRVGHWSFVGAGGVVNRDLPANVTAVGVPARVISSRPEGWQLA